MLSCSSLLGVVLVLVMNASLSLASDLNNRLMRACELDNSCDNPLRTRSYSITCCAEGTPQVVQEIQEYVFNFTSEFKGSASSFNDSCYRYHGNYTYSTNASVDLAMGVRCKCSDSTMDRNCRKLGPCQNGGYRAFSINLRCACPDRYFGETCEFYCEHGRRVKDKTGIDYCVCDQYYLGHSCNQIQCLNGGTPSTDHTGCYCHPPYLGKHCMHRLTQSYTHSPDDNLTGSFKKDFTGTLISLLLVVTLLCAMYCMLRRRLHSSSNRHNAFFAELVSARREMLARELSMLSTVTTARSLVTQPLANQSAADMPPSYSMIGQMLSPATTATPLDGDELPPLPSYEDAIKLATPTNNNPNNSTINESINVRPITDGAAQAQVHAQNGDSDNQNRSNVVIE